MCKSIWPVLFENIGGGDGGVSWGAITGTLSAQSDLQTALNTKVTSAFGISAGSGLSGGGALTASVTLSLSATPSTAHVGVAVSGQLTAAGSPITATGTVTIGMQTSSVTAGTYGNTTAVPVVTFNQFGQATAASNVAINFPAGGATALVVQDEGNVQGTVSVVNFAGSGVTAAATGGTALVTINAGGGADPWTYAILGSQFRTTFTAAQLIGLGFVPAANTRYEFEFHIWTRAQAATTGPRVGIAWPTGLTDGVGSIEAASSGTAKVIANGNINGPIICLNTGLANSTQSHPTFGWGSFRASTPTGTMQLTLQSEIGASTVMAEVSSFLRWRSY